MYFREQDPQNKETDIPEISSLEQFNQFKAEEQTIKLYESEAVVIG